MHHLQEVNRTQHESRKQENRMGRKRKKVKYDKNPNESRWEGRKLAKEYEKYKMERRKNLTNGELNKQGKQEIAINHETFQKRIINGEIKRKIGLGYGEGSLNIDSVNVDDIRTKEI